MKRYFSFEQILEINAAFATLIEFEKNKERIPVVAQFIIDLFHTIQKSSGFTIAMRSTNITPKNEIVGETGIGPVTIHEDEEEKTTEVSYGYKKTRVGHYKIWRGDDGCLYFSHFWKSDLSTTTDEDEVEYYAINFNQKSLQFNFFGPVIVEEKFRILRFVVSQTMIHSVLDDKKHFCHLDFSFSI